MAKKREIIKVGICGVGAVGGTLHKWLKIHTQHEIFLYDPDKGYTDDLSEVYASFICVPVPTNEDGTQDVSMLEDAVKRCGGVRFIRSTVLPSTNDKYGTFSCPEFLTERNAVREMSRQPILTGCSDVSFMRNIFPYKKILRHSNYACESAKYFHNAFGAIKVNFFNIVYDFCQQRELDYESVLQGILSSGYIKREHTQVPGPDGSRGFGGKCFPKDLKALNAFFPKQTFEACMEENSIYRGTQ